MVLAIAVAAVAVLGAVVALAMGKGGELADTHPDHPPLPLPDERPLVGMDAAVLHLPRGLWGYHVAVTDEALRRLAYALTERETRVAMLERELNELRHQVEERDRLARPAIPVDDALFAAADPQFAEPSAPWQPLEPLESESTPDPAAWWNAQPSPYSAPEPYDERPASYESPASYDERPASYDEPSDDERPSATRTDEAAGAGAMPTSWGGSSSARRPADAEPPALPQVKLEMPGGVPADLEHEAGAGSHVGPRSFGQSPHSTDTPHDPGTGTGPADEESRWPADAPPDRGAGAEDDWQSLESTRPRGVRVEAEKSGQWVSPAADDPNGAEPASVEYGWQDEAEDEPVTRRDRDGR